MAPGVAIRGKQVPLRPIFAPPGPAPIRGNAASTRVSATVHCGMLPVARAGTTCRVPRRPPGADATAVSPHPRTPMDFCRIALDIHRSPTQQAAFAAFTAALEAEIPLHCAVWIGGDPVLRICEHPAGVELPDELGAMALHVNHPEVFPVAALSPTAGIRYPDAEALLLPLGDTHAGAADAGGRRRRVRRGPGRVGRRRRGAGAGRRARAPAARGPRRARKLPQARAGDGGAGRPGPGRQPDAGPAGGRLARRAVRPDAAGRALRRPADGGGRRPALPGRRGAAPLRRAAGRRPVRAARRPLAEARRAGAGRDGGHGGRVRPAPRAGNARGPRRAAHPLRRDVRRARRRLPRPVSRQRAGHAPGAHPGPARGRRHQQRPPARRPGRPLGGAAARQRGAAPHLAAQGALLRRHEPRAAHARQRHPGPAEPAAGGHLGRGARAHAHAAGKGQRLRPHAAAPGGRDPGLRPPGSRQDGREPGGRGRARHGGGRASRPWSRRRPPRASSWKRGWTRRRWPCARTRTARGRSS